MIKRTRTLSILCLFSFLMATQALAQQGFRSGYKSNNLTIEPVVGLERVQKIEPTAHSKNRFYYGARFRYGVPLFSGELELTQSKESNNYPEQDLKIEEDTTTLMLGLRSSINHAGMISAYARAGAHARKREIEKEEAGVQTLDEPSPRISPYAGAGLNFRLASYFSLNAGYTVIFTGEPRGSDRDYQTSLGFTLSI